MKKIIIAIDGHSGCGKSTTAKAVAKALNYIYVDTGAMYRAVTLYFIQNQIDTKDANSIFHALDNINITFRYNKEIQKSETVLNGKGVEDAIRGMEVSQMVSKVSEISAVRKKLVEQQRAMGRKKGLVMDGRDIGTVVFPQAELKIFMTADVKIRAGRRQKELLEKNQKQPLDDVIKNLKMRDEIDSSRKDSPLKKAPDAFVIDTSYLTFETQVNRVLDLARKTSATSNITT